MASQLDRLRGADRAVLVDLLRQRRRLQRTIDRLSDTRLAALYGVEPGDVRLLELASRNG
jgi:hypothetical protein